VRDSAVRIPSWGIALAAFAINPALADEIGTCRAIKDAAQRLACFDAAAGPARAVAPAPAPESGFGTLAPVTSAWTFDESRSPVDDSQQIIATNTSEDAAGARTVLIVRCREHHTELYIASEAFWGISYGDQMVPVLYRVNAMPAVQQKWNPGHGGGLGGSAFLPGAGTVPAFIDDLPDSGKIFFRITDFQGVAHDVSFVLDGVNSVRERVGDACKWPSSLTRKAKSQ